MERLQIPKPSAFIKGFCKKTGVRLINFKSPAEFEQEVIQFIKKHDIVFLATSAKDFPRCTPLGYRNLGTTLYILSEGGGKFANLKKNKMSLLVDCFKNTGRQKSSVGAGAAVLGNRRSYFHEKGA